MKEVTVTEGMQVGWTPFETLIPVIVTKVGDSLIWFKEGGCHISQLKTLVVEYIDYSPHHITGNPVPELKQLPLKYSQWQSAIDNSEVDSEKEVEFKIINFLNATEFGSIAKKR